MNRKTLTTLCRDVVSMGIGSFGIIHQELTRQVSIELLVVYLVLLGFPAAAGLMNLLLPGEDEIEESPPRKKGRRYRRHTTRP